MILPETYARIPNVAPIIEDVPAANPSRPSVKFAPFDTATIIKMKT